MTLDDAVNYAFSFGWRRQYPAFAQIVA